MVILLFVGDVTVFICTLPVLKVGVEWVNDTVEMATMAHSNDTKDALGNLHFDAYNEIRRGPRHEYKRQTIAKNWGWPYAVALNDK